ncbi:MAG: hypothetical protein JF625_13875 [Inquilinus limosus]|uniref:OmpA-like domain-containing protein n=1 Tax=Inquilinus limosus TaxID=171674 RepID=A0A952KHY9_9PROT|nr:hypothetical protein [Inquilinus limosus]
MAGRGEDHRETVVTIGGTRALLAVRLCNFETSRSYLLREHMDALDRRVRPLLHSLKGSWVDLIGYASHRGAEGFNQALSEQRCRKVQDYLAVLDDVKFQIVQGLGESRSGPDGDADNSGWWRAVEVYVYGTKPRPDAPDVDTSTEFQIRVLAGASGGVYAANFDDYTFEIVDTRRNVGAKFLFIGAGLSLTAVVPQIPGLPVSQTKAGNFTPFRTSAPVRLADFAGWAQLYQDPGATLGSWSVAGTLRLSIESDRVVAAGARVMPSIIPISGGWGLQTASLGSASVGRLSMEGAPTPR